MQLLGSSLCFQGCYYAMVLLGCSRWLLGCCYVFARVLCVVAKVLLCGC